MFWLRREKMLGAAAVVIAAVLLAAPALWAADVGTNREDWAAFDTGERDREIPSTVWFQGFAASTSTGSGLNGDFDMVVELYDAAMGGASLWGPETHNATPVNGGWFNIELGITEHLPAFDSPPYYLELTIGGEILMPRQGLGSVPSAFRAAVAESLVGMNELSDGDWSIDGENIYRTSGKVGVGMTPHAVYPVAIASGDQNEALWVQGAFNKGTTIFVDGGSSARLDLKHTSWDNPTLWSIISGGGGFAERQYLHFNNDGTDHMVLANWGDVGIGTTPTTKLDVAGTAQVTGFKMPTGASDGHVLTSDVDGVAAWEAPSASAPDDDWTISGDDMYTEVTGNVGIGTTTPSARLEVEGRAIFDGLGRPVAHGGSETTLDFEIGGGDIGWLVTRVNGSGNTHVHGQMWSVVTSATSSSMVLMSDMEETHYIDSMTITALGGPSYNHRIQVNLNGNQDNVNVFWIRIGD